MTVETGPTVIVSGEAFGQPLREGERYQVNRPASVDHGAVVIVAQDAVVVRPDGTLRRIPQCWLQRVEE